MTAAIMVRLVKVAMVASCAAFSLLVAYNNVVDYGANLAFVAFSRYLNSMDGQIIVVFVMSVAAAEAAVGLAIIMAMYRTKKTVNADEMNLMKW